MRGASKGTLRFETAAPSNGYCSATNISLSIFTSVVARGGKVEVKRDPGPLKMVLVERTLDPDAHMERLVFSLTFLSDVIPLCELSE